MPYRLAGRAENRIDSVLLESAGRWGIDAAARYHRLIIVAMAVVGDFPALPGSRDVPEVAGVRTLHLRSARRLVTREHRVAEPRHLLIYRVAPDGVVEILGLVHDRMLLARAARRAKRENGWLKQEAALQFPFGHPSVASVIPGGLALEHVTRNVATYRHPISPTGNQDFR